MIILIVQEHLSPELKKQSPSKMPKSCIYFNCVFKKKKKSSHALCKQMLVKNVLWQSPMSLHNLVQRASNVKTPCNFKISLTKSVIAMIKAVV